ncbi:MAG: NAD+ synthase [Bdellovibrionales bacterium]|nr:NAD+ synthase [Bdellovibrionales bacterium]
MKIAQAQINPILGNFKYNCDLHLEAIEKILSKDSDTDLIIFPECSLFGYHPVDLLERSEIVDLQLMEMARLTSLIPNGVRLLVGGITKNNVNVGKPYYNSAILLERNSVIKTFNKELLPTYDVFDEARHIEAGDLSKNIFKWKGYNILVTICEDIWGWKNSNGSQRSIYGANPLLKISPENVDLVLNLSASPFSDIKWGQRMAVANNVVNRFECPLVYTNMVGAQDELIYDGQSFVMLPDQSLAVRALGFESDINTFEFDSNINVERVNREPLADKIPLKMKAICLGIKDFVRKSGFQKVHVGLSGGVDSALVSALVSKAIGAENVVNISLPGPFNAEDSLSWAKKQSENIGNEFVVLPIEGIYEKILETLKSSLGDFGFGLVNENLQARIRGMLLMAYSNLNHSLLINTSNKSELAMGYSTLYGDLVGGLSPIGDLLKHEVYDMVLEVNSERELIPLDVIKRAPSAELRPNQKDQDTLPEYNLLDNSVKRLVEEIQIPSSEIDHVVIRSLMRTEFKRWQAPPVLRVSDHAFGRGRRLPIAHQYLQ